MSGVRAPASERGACVSATGFTDCCFSMVLAASTSGHAVSAANAGLTDARNARLIIAASTFFIVPSFPPGLWSLLLQSPLRPSSEAHTQFLQPSWPGCPPDHNL